MSRDLEYEDMMRHQRKADRMLEAAHYRISDSPRCGNCRYFEPGFELEDANICKRVNKSLCWVVGTVSVEGICDRWKGRRE